MTKKQALEQFKRLFWEARRLSKFSMNEQAEAKFREARDIARAEGLEAEAQVAEASFLDISNKHAEAEAAARAAAEHEHLTLKGLAWFIMGSARLGQRDAQGAIEFYHKALDDPTFDTPGNAWNNMGLAHSEKKDYDKAIECYQKALDDPTLHTPGAPWFNMGMDHHEKKDYVKAIECFEKALEDKALPERGQPWANMGKSYASMGDAGQAVRCYRQASQAYAQDEAVMASSFFAGMASAMELKPGQRSSDDDALLAAGQQETLERPMGDPPERRMLLKLKGASRTAYEDYRRSFKPNEALSHSLAILKGWGSAVPLVVGGTTGCRGGGYLLKWNGRGIAIDPGFDFLRNLGQMGFHVLEVNAVVVSHNHTDHNQDLRPLDDVKYELSKLSTPHEVKYFLLWDEDTATNVKFDPIDAAHRHSMKFDLQRQELGQEAWVDLRKLSGDPFEVSYFKAKHSENVPNAVSLFVRCFDGDEAEPGATVGFSCDTSFYPELCDEDHLGTCDLLVAHISQPDVREFDDPEFLKRDHLGYRGVEKLVKGCSPKLTVVCEFWAGMADLRIELVQGLRELCGINNILPGGVGLLINPRTLQIRCTSCKENWRAADKIVVAGPDQPFGPLKYLCENCRL